MNSFSRIASVALIALTVLTACADQQHPLEQQLRKLPPGTAAVPRGLSGSEGTLLCVFTAYQSELAASEPLAERVNAFLTRKKFRGEEGRWSIILAKPSPAGDDGMELLSFKSGKYEVINKQGRLTGSAAAVHKNFRVQTCMPLAHARVLITRGRHVGSFFVSFGTESTDQKDAN